MARFVKGIGSAAKNFFVGSSEVDKMYLGNTLIYKNLPYDAEVEYLESTGSQWIGTEINPNGYTSIEVKFKYNVKTNQMRVFGARTNNTSDLVMQSYINGSGQFATSFAVNGDWMSTGVTADTYVHILKINSSNLGVYLDGTLKNTRTSRPSVTANDKLRLFSCGTWADNGSNLNGRIYYAKIWSNDTLVRDFIPVRVGQVGYMYDKVSKQLFGNAGSGSFTLGSDV